MGKTTPTMAQPGHEGQQGIQESMLSEFEHEMATMGSFSNPSRLSPRPGSSIPSP
jgi:hypothetical protein